ncbi:hypothetical protein PFICI_09511 [Pestalotiopsis fici W106-1]|uniref:Uncharacterized protein n=1 Tax=Pestalotiopsis fici (strain W106-1 / CGMCC3.15140) TaxID=1229662 RepID=W3X0J7_PESFW|nr:uncharacterized protein PFICI_09511 [Pestalotiopsis fici W106-1]ETS79658.1 hypothetical protein PFICI_09511 [Pestalotiopsis fici W106-1]
MPVEYVRSYNLPSDKLKQYLQEQFPSTFIHLRDNGNDSYAVVLPRGLTQAQKDDVKGLRSGEWLNVPTSLVPRPLEQSPSSIDGSRKGERSDHIALDVVDSDQRSQASTPRGSTFASFFASQYGRQMELSTPAAAPQPAQEINPLLQFGGANVAADTAAVAPTGSPSPMDNRAAFQKLILKLKKQRVSNTPPFAGGFSGGFSAPPAEPEWGPSSSLASPSPYSPFNLEHRDGPPHKSFYVGSSGHTAAGTIPSDSGYASLPTISTTVQRMTDTDRLTIRSSVETIEGDVDIKIALVRAFVDEITSRLAPTTLNGVEQGEKLEYAVEALLKTVAETLEPIAESKSQRQGVLFLRQQRRRISREILTGARSTEGSIESSGNSTPVNQSTHEGMGSDEIMNWLSDQTQWPQLIEEDNLPLGSDESHYFEQSRVFITQSDAFRWLIDQLTATMELAGIENVSILNHCIITEFDRRASPKQVASADFVISGRLDLFLKEYFGDAAACNLGDVLVVVRNEDNHQMLSCRQYMRQTWPSSGEATLTALQKGLDAYQRNQTHDAQDSFDGGTIRLRVEKETTSVLVCAPKLRLCDVGAQICWIAAVCQFPADDEWLLSSAFLIHRGLSNDGEFRNDHQPTLSFEVNIERKRIAPLGPSNHDCWKLLLRSSNIVTGFPIANRTARQKGMEIALEVMAQSAGAQRVTTFDDKIVLKGFSSLLVAVSCDDLSITWHYIESADLSRIPFSAAKSIHTEELDLSYMKDKRHFLGWTPAAAQEAGTRNAKYADITRSRSETVSGPRFALSGINLSVSKYISGGASFLLSERANSLRLKREGPFERKIYSLSRMYVVLYDDLDHRGWLIDGASAVLHALRCQLTKPPYDKSRLFEPSAFKYSEGYGGPAASMEALLNIDFRRMRVFESLSEAGEGPPGAVRDTEKVTYWTIQGMIEDLWDVFEQMHDHQEKLKSSPGIELRFDRGMLEGWSFVDLLSEPVLQARSVKLTSSGKGWVDFTRAIQAVTFLARDFGEIIKPIHEESSCFNWAQVPRGIDYLAVRLQLLKQISDVYGDPSATPLKLANGIYWHKPHQLFEDCGCVASTSGANCDRVQVLLPEFTLGRKTHPGIDLADHSVLGDAAVIFGRSTRLPRHWPSKDRSKESIPTSGSGASISDDSRGSPGGSHSPFSAAASEQSSKSSRNSRLWLPLGRREQK